MTLKEEYRCYFLTCQEYVKLGNIVSECSLQPSRLSKFIKGDNSQLSLEKLELITKAIKITLKSIVDIDEI